MEREELQERIAAFPRWHYRFEFDGGVSTPLVDRDMINRHEQRRRYFFAPLLSTLGGSLEGRRVLDLGCNAGFWSLQAIDAGADFVLGVDGRETHIEQAELVFSAKGVDPARYRFETGNVFTHAISESFDVVLCLGLLDHVCKPIELFELMSASGAELIVIDTDLSRASSGYFEICSLFDSRNAIDRAMVLLPTRQAVIELAQEFGYQAVALEQNFTDHAGLTDYRHQRRLAFICAKSTSLGALSEAKRPLPGPWWLGMADPRGLLDRLRG